MTTYEVELTDPRQKRYIEVVEAAERDEAISQARRAVYARLRVPLSLRSVHRRCADCQGTGERVLNSAWPSGDKPYSERCSTCGGSGHDDDV